MTAIGAPHRVVVVGGGFGGLQAALELRRASVEVTLVDRRNFHLFQPLTYQVATGALSPGEVAYPLRAIFKRDRNVRVLMAEVADFDLEAHELRLRTVAGIPAPRTVSYDTLIVAGGSRYSYFGHDDWRRHALEVKSLESALVARSRLLGAFEAAEMESDPEQRDAWLTFVVVGAGQPAWRWPARSPSSHATRCGATSAGSTRGRAASCSSRRQIASSPPSRARSRRKQSDHCRSSA